MQSIFPERMISSLSLRRTDGPRVSAGRFLSWVHVTRAGDSESLGAEQRQLFGD